MDKIKLKKGLKADIGLLDLAEPVFTVDENRFYIGSSTGNVAFYNKQDVDEQLAIVSGQIGSSTELSEALALKENITDNNAKLALKENTATLTPKLALKEDISANNIKLALKANLASPTFTSPSANTASPGTNNGQLATTQFVTTANNLKANLASPTFSGAPLTPTPTTGDNSTKIASTAFVATAVTNGVNSANALSALNLLNKADNSDFTKLDSAEGWEKNAITGVIRQWGIVICPANTTFKLVTFPVPFPNNCRSIVLTNAFTISRTTIWSASSLTVNGMNCYPIVCSTGGEPTVSSSAYWEATGF